MGVDTLLNIKELNAFLRKHKHVDFRTVDLLNISGLTKFSWPKDEKEKNQLLHLVKSYQRLLRILPSGKEDIAKNLLKMGINSSLQIAQMGKKKFIADTKKAFGKTPELAEQVYKRALVARKLVTFKYINQRQQLEPHARTAGLA